MIYLSPSTLPLGQSILCEGLFGSGPQIEMRVLFVLAALLLACGSLWLLAIRLGSSSLKGIGWLSGAAALGAGGLVFSSYFGHLPLILSVVFAAELMLLANVLIELSLIEILENEARVPTFNLVMVALGMLILPFFAYEHKSDQLLQLVFDSLMVLQLGRNIIVLWQRRKPHFRNAMIYALAGLCSFLVWEAAKIFLVSRYWVPRSPLMGNWFENLTLFFYLLNSLWVVSGIFWLTMLQLTTRLEKMADTDPLTRLANRRVFCDWMQRELLRSLRTGVPFSLLVIDLDHFKRVNDTLGHTAGDDVLRLAVERMQDSVRGIDVLGRWGGEEFVALLPRATVEAAELVAERIRRNMEVPVTLKVRGEDEKLTITVSLGVTSYRGSDDTVDDMFLRADAALFQAKAAGRNCILTTA